ncbi:hypothetical protein D1AOALGA4SA_2526 [Olavius algarvensis Delta 1 endosymbiont]|nr:hypothetical protein D1AOALGA4SA_2526 [Olavius algarvensis Delta 1 endosymbiont]
MDWGQNRILEIRLRVRIADLGLRIADLGLRIADLWNRYALSIINGPFDTIKLTTGSIP